MDNLVTSSGKINISTASVEDLITLSGIGTSLAERIINYREVEGEFESLEKLKEVPGIGEKLFGTIKDDITNEMQEMSFKQLKEDPVESSEMTNDVAEKKFIEEESKEIDLVKQYPIPDKYSINTISLQIKNPTTAHLYWEYTQEVLNRISFEAGYNNIDEAWLVLRVCDLTIVEEYNIDITTFHDSWYLNDLVPDHSYIVKLGIIDVEGRFKSILQSNQITMPANRMSDLFDEEWMTVKEKMEKIYALSGGLLGAGPSSLDVVKKLDMDIDISQLQARLEEGVSSPGLLKGSAEFLGGSREVR